jgi:hypothetical protein
MEAMVTLRCTKKLRQRLGTRTFEERGPSTTVLGDWYGDTLFTRHARFVILVSEKSRLAVLLRARDFPTFEIRFRAAVVETLRLLEVSEEAIRREAEGMEEVAYAPTNNRSVLGTIHDHHRLMRGQLEDHPAKTLMEYGAYLNMTPCGPLQYSSPDQITQLLFSDWLRWKFPPVLQ